MFPYYGIYGGWGKTGITEAPYRFLAQPNGAFYIKTVNGKDSVSAQKSYLSKAKRVMAKIEETIAELESLSKVQTDKHLKKLSYEALRAIFSKAFLHLPKAAYRINDENIDMFDSLRVADVSYLTFHDSLFKCVRKKRAVQADAEPVD
jgi:hypothetical protein